MGGIEAGKLLCTPCLTLARVAAEDAHLDEIKEEDRAIAAEEEGVVNAREV